MYTFGYRSSPDSSGPDSDHNTHTSVLNDGGTSNLSRRVSLDGEESGYILLTSKSQIVSCKKQAIIRSFNARTLGPLGRLEELAECSKSQNIDILAIQEHRFHHPNDVLKYHQAGSFQLVTSSAPKNSGNSSVGGVGFLLSSAASDNLLGIESISSRIMVLELEGNPKTTVICVYSPHNSSSKEDIEDFYTTLRSTIEQVPLHNFLVIAGELKVVIKQLKSSKAFGPDNIPALIWKDEHFNSLLLNLCNHTFDTYKPSNI